MRTVLACWIALGLIFVLTQRPVRTAFASESDAVIQLRTYDYARAGSLTIEKAQKRVSLVFNRVGINTQWVTDGQPQFRIMIIEQMDAIMTASGEVFGYTPRDPGGTSSGMAYVAYGSIRTFVRTPQPGRPQLDLPDILGYCIAHEIGHLLLPPRSHSPTGIMRARWREDDFKLMATGRLLFTDHEVILLKNEALRLAQHH